MMLSRRTFVTMGAVFALGTAGCFQVEPQGNRQIGFETGRVVASTDGEYVFESRLSGVSHRTENRTYQNVSVEFYSSDRQLLAKKDAPSISTDDQGSVVTVMLDEKPGFIVPVSPDFWEDSNLEVYGLEEMDNGQYDWYRVTSGRTFPES